MKKLFILAILAPFFLQSACPTEFKESTDAWGCTPKKIFCPTTKEELQDAVKIAIKENRSIRAYGGGHGGADIVCTGTDGYLINTDQLCRILNLDVEKRTVTVESGMRIWNLLQELAKVGLTLSAQTSCTQASMGGVTATSSHGERTKKTPMCDAIIDIELIDGNGNWHYINEKSPADEYAAIHEHLGLLGVVYSLTLECEPLFLYERESFAATTIEEALSQYKELLGKHDECSLAFSLYKDSAKGGKRAAKFARISDITTKCLTPDARLLAAATAINGAKAKYESAAETTYDLLKKDPGAFGTRRIGGASKKTIDYGFNLIGLYNLTGRNANFLQEVGVPVHRMNEAILAVCDLAEEYQKKGVVFISGFRTRYVSQNKRPSLISASHDQDIVWIFAGANFFHSLSPLYRKEIFDFYKDWEQLAIEKFEGRPHTGKIFFFTKAQMQKIYGDNFTKFVALRRKFDPKGIFLNQTLKEVFE